MIQPSGPLHSPQAELYKMSNSKTAYAAHAVDGKRPAAAPFEVPAAADTRCAGRTVNLTCACTRGHFALHNPAEQHTRAASAILMPCADASSIRRELQFTTCQLFEGKWEPALFRYRKPLFATCMTASTLLYPETRP